MSAMTLTVFTSPSGVVKAFQGGTIDWAPDLRAADVAGLTVSDDATLLHMASLRGYNYLAFNTREGRIFANSVTRRALAACVDLPAIITGATDETGIKISSTVAPTSWAAENPAAAEAARDVAGARAALIADGWEAGEDGVFTRAGTRLEADIIVREGQVARTRAAQLIVDQVAECGISSPSPSFPLLPTSRRGCATQMTLISISVRGSGALIPMTQTFSPRAPAQPKRLQPERISSAGRAHPSISSLPKESLLEALALASASTPPFSRFDAASARTSSCGAILDTLCCATGSPGRHARLICRVRSTRGRSTRGTCKSRG